MKHSVESYLPFLINAANLAIYECELPDKLKKSEEIPLHKKQDSLKKENYRPVSLLPHVSRVFECILYAHNNHCAKSVRIQSYSFPDFPRIFPLRTEYGEIRRMQENARKMRNRITPNSSTLKEYNRFS